MHAYTQIQLGFVGTSAVTNALAALGITDENGNPVSAQDLLDDCDAFFDATTADSLYAPLENAYLDVVCRLGWTDLGSDRYYRNFQTPHGIRRAIPFTLRFDYYPTEIGDTAEDCTLSIALTSRYYPTLLDIASPNGGITPTLDLTQALSTAALCKDIVAQRLPAFATASVYLRHVFA